jgi:DNA-binding IclR family transcriptional regulator
MSSVDQNGGQAVTEPTWRFFTNHFEVLLYVARHPDARLRIVADEVGITERAAHRLLTQLVAEGYLTVNKAGRRNHYRVSPGTTLRHRANAGVPLQPLVDIVNAGARDLHAEEADR